jgi:SAM-dependent methyltransferase
VSFQLVVEALRAELDASAHRARRLGLAPSEAWNVLVVALLRALLSELGSSSEALASGRLFTSVPGFEADRRQAARAQFIGEIAVSAPRLEQPWSALPVEAFGQLYESLLAARPSDGPHSLRKRTGSYYTPESLTEVVVGRAMSTLGPLAPKPLRILDPAMGAGAFLMQAGRETARRSGRALSQVVANELFGVDISPLAVAVAEASLWLLASEPALSLRDAGTHLYEGDALLTPSAAKKLGRRGVDFGELSFDLVVGNPPWVAFAGRATQPLEPALREHYRAAFQAFRGYPTLHALFVELGARLAPRGVLALLIPSPLSDLDGYRPARSALAASHAVCEPLLELGQDAFASVTQPCFALVAAPRREPEADPGRAFVLSERRSAAATASQLRTPTALERLATLPRFPEQLFGEMGLQTNSAVTKQLLYRGTAPPAGYDYALLEGRNVAEFRLAAPRLFMKRDQAVLTQNRCRVRAVSEYQRVKVVVRQTAAITIAAAHDGTPFRNSLLAAFETEELPFELTLGLLNSTLYRALHLAARRDARQGAFPQVKIGHLRALPAPPRSGETESIARLAREASARGLDAELRRALDAAVFSQFGIAPGEAEEISAFVRERSPQAGLTAPMS